MVESSRPWLAWPLYHDQFPRTASTFPVRRNLTSMTAFFSSIVRTPTTRTTLAKHAAAGFGDMVKAVVDVDRGVMAIGAELHADEEAALLEDGSRQASLWGINLYPGEPDEDWIEFDSMINVRPAQGNRSRGVTDPTIQTAIRRIVSALVTSP